MINLDRIKKILMESYKIIQRHNFMLTKLSKSITRLILNIITLSSLIWLSYYAKQLFSHSVDEPLKGSLILLSGFTGWIIFIKTILHRYRRIFPNFRFTTFILLCSITVMTFAGVQPLADYKDEAIEKITIFYKAKTEQIKIEQEKQLVEIRAEEQKITEQKEADRKIKEAEQKIIDERSRIKNAELLGEMYNGITLQNPTWNELKVFLLEDDTDEIPYDYPNFVCADFADRVQNNAKASGWRCAVVSMDMTGYDDPFNFGIASDAGHACNAFETTDRGLVYIDCTGLPDIPYKPANCDKIVDVVVGDEYVPISIFPESGWSNTWEDAGKVTGINIKW